MKSKTIQSSKSNKGIMINYSMLYTMIIPSCKHTSILLQIQGIIHLSWSTQQNQYGKNCYQAIKSSYSLFTLRSWSNEYSHKLSSRNSPQFLDYGTYKKNIQVVYFGTQIFSGPWVLAMVPFGTQIHVAP